MIVVSHERSGTHFLINSISRVFGYSELLNFDSQSLKIDYRSPAAVARILAQVGAAPKQSVVKSHHAAGFFGGVLDRILARTPILYIHRHPVEVMISFWRYARKWMPAETMAATTATDFAVSAPSPSMSRYQTVASASVLDRWAHHVDGWTAAAENRPRLAVVRFDRLRDNYARTITNLGALLGPVSGSLEPPDRDTNVVSGIPADQLPAPDRIALGAIAMKHVGATMRRHGYA